MTTSQNPSIRQITLRGHASAREIAISGSLKTNGSGVPPIEHHGAIETLPIAGGCVAAGSGFDNI